MRIVLCATALACWSLAVALPATAGRSPGPLSAAPAGRLGAAPDGVSTVEELAFDPAVPPALLRLAPGESLRFEAWPTGPGVRRAAVLTRFDVYAPDARIVAIDHGREIEVPRSSRVFFLGRDAERGSVRFSVSLDPATGALSGLVLGEGEPIELRPPATRGGRHVLGRVGAFRDPKTPPPVWECGNESLPAPGAEPSAREPGALPAPDAVTKVGVIAVDTDNELMSLKFGNNTTSATTYIANLFVQMNVIYERDTPVRLLQGYTVLRLSTTADPWAQSGTGNVDSAKLNEFSNYWSANYPNVRRALAMFLSGKQASNFSASGRAFAGPTTLCSTTSGYSFSQVFKFTTFSEAYDVLITAHEIGHNFSSPHTHCYADPKPDTCYGSESGCFSGTGSCPPQQTINGYVAIGTLMSYCHISPCNSDTTLVFHPETMSRYLTPAIAAASCLPAVGNARPTVTGIFPAAGTTSGATAVTITGTNFRSGATAAFVDLTGSVALSSVSFVNATTLTATTPAHAAGAMDVVVFNDDRQTGTLGNGFAYQALVAPAVTAISPNNGSTLGGTPVTITGTGFQSGATVSLGGVAATGVSVLGATTITAATGAHVTGVVDVVVSVPTVGSGTLPAGYFYVPPAASSVFHTLTPCRAVDTRLGAGPLGGPALSAGQARSFPVTSSSCGVPGTARAISVNLTVTEPAANGYLALFPGNGLPLATSTLNFRAGQTRANNASVSLATDGSGSIGVLNGSTGIAHVVLDVNGYFE